MVNFEIPNQYTFSPSEGTPHLTINREATIDLDSSNAFEGKESIVVGEPNINVKQVLRSF